MQQSFLKFIFWLKGWWERSWWTLHCWEYTWRIISSYHLHFSVSCIGEGNGNPLQCSCLEDLRDGGAWWAAIYGVPQSQTWLKWLSSSSMLPILEGLWEAKWCLGMLGLDYLPLLKGSLFVIDKGDLTCFIDHRCQATK